MTCHSRSRTRARCGCRSVDLETLHILRVELGFEDDVSASREVVFGGVYFDRTQAELTAMVAHGGLGRASPENLQGRVQAGTDYVRVVAVESGPLDVVVVRDRGAVEGLTEYLRREARTMRRSNKSLSGATTDGRLKRLLPLQTGASLRFVWPAEDPERAVIGSSISSPTRRSSTTAMGALAYLTALVATPGGAG